MDTKLLDQIDGKIQDCTQELAALTIRLVNIKSEKTAPVPGGPFGEGCKQVLDTVMELGQQEGFFCTDYHLGVMSAALKAGQPDLGIWLHGDVVPAGDGWLYEPYQAVEHDGCIIGRGATDNKGQLAAMFLLLKIFKQLNISLSYNPAIYVGSNEETGMADLVGDPNIPGAKGFLNEHTPPRLSLVPDSGFPVGYGGKGSLKLTLKSTAPLQGFTLWAGQSDSPGRATAVFDRTDLPEDLPACTVTKDTRTEIVTESPPIHAAHPKPGGNMITQICSALLDAQVVAAENRPALEFCKAISLDIHGQVLGIETPSTQMGDLTVCATSISMVDGCPALSLNIRYPIEITCEQILERITNAAEKWGFVIHKANKGSLPYLLDPNSDIVQTLCAISNEQTGKEAAPYTLSGGTYAHRLPNAYPYGASGNRKPADFPQGHGGAHGKDESVGLDRLQRAMRIYARALLALNEMSW